MAGHNKWSKVKHRKARVDKKRSKIWSAIARDIIFSARAKGGDPNTNLKLKYAIDEAKRNNMPLDTIDRAIKRGTGELAGADPEEVIYEGYAPGGVALLVMALTDNRNRTAPLVKRAFEKNAGKIGEPGSVQYLFETKGRIQIAKKSVQDLGFTEDELLEIVLEAGAEELEGEDSDSYEILSNPSDFEAIKDVLRGKTIQWEVAERAFLPSATIMLDLENARQVLSLIDDLEEEDDVQSVAGNFDIPEEIIKELTAS